MRQKVKVLQGNYFDKIVLLFLYSCAICIQCFFVFIFIYHFVDRDEVMRMLTEHGAERRGMNEYDTLLNELLK